MTGLFNTIGHETESQTKTAASHLFEALASVNQMLAKVELGDIPAADVERQHATNQLSQVASTFEELSTNGSDIPLFLSGADSAISPAELSELQGQLRRYSVSLALRNRDLFGIAAREIRLLVDVLQHVTFVGRHADWYAMRDVVDQVNRLTTLGVTFSRIASLEGNDPQLRS